MRIKYLAVTLFALMVGYGFASIQSAKNSRDNLLELCRNFAGIMSIDATTGASFQVQKWKCPAGSLNRCLSMQFDPVTPQQKSVPLGYIVSPASFQDGVGVDVRIFRTGTNTYLQYRNFVGSEPGWAGLLGDMAPIGQRSSVSCFKY